MVATLGTLFVAGTARVGMIRANRYMTGENDTMKILIWLVLSFFAGVFGRIGGWEKGNRLFRLFGVPACCVLMLFLFTPLHGDFKYYSALALCFLTILGASSTYFKSKGAEAKWWNWILVGLVEGVAVLPYVLYVHDWIGFALRTLACVALIVTWDELIDWDVAEEFGRYFLIAATIPLLLFF